MSQTSNTPHPKPYVLIQNDCQPQLEVLQEMVTTAFPLDTVLTTNPVQALKTIAHRPPVLVITDLNHPHLRGEDTIRWIKRTCPAVPILVTTGDTESRQQQALAAGANMVLSAPYRYEAIVASIRQLVQPLE